MESTKALTNFIDTPGDTVNIVNTTWKSQFEELVPTGTKSIPSQVRPPKPELKPLPLDLQYAYLGEDDTYPVVISSHLDKDKEIQLLNILEQDKDAMTWIVADVKGH